MAYTPKNDSSANSAGLNTEFTEILGFKISKNYWLCYIALAFAVIGFGISAIFPDDGYAWQISIKFRNLFFYFSCIWIIRNLDLVKIPFQQSIKAVLDKGIEHPHYGRALIAQAIYFSVIIAACATVIVAGT